jgi:hypothetical protein
MQVNRVYTDFRGYFVTYQPLSEPKLFVCNILRLIRDCLKMAQFCDLTGLIWDLGVRYAYHPKVLRNAKETAF